MTRVIFWLSVAAALAALLWYMVSSPGTSYRGALKPLTDAEREIAANLLRHVTAVASREHNMLHADALEVAARHIEATLAGFGYSPAAQRFLCRGIEVRNIEVEIRGGARQGEIVVLGAHYDSVLGSAGANDNGSGVAALLELARLLRDSRPASTVRFVWFVNEEPPFFKGEDMGSRRYVRRSRERGERIVAMASLETIGWYSDAPASQRYPFPLGFFYPDRGDFIAFVSNLTSRGVMHDALAAFRRAAEFPSEAVAAPAVIPGVDWSDHGSFWEQGYPAFMLTDTAPYRYPFYHSARDTPEKVQYERLARLIQGIRAMVEALAQVPKLDPGPPAGG